MQLYSGRKAKGGTCGSWKLPILHIFDSHITQKILSEIIAAIRIIWVHYCGYGMRHGWCQPGTAIRESLPGKIVFVLHDGRIDFDIGPFRLAGDPSATFLDFLGE
jgi:hypothetical protein